MLRSSGFGYNSGVPQATVTAGAMRPSFQSSFARVQRYSESDNAPQVLSLGKAAVLKTFWRQAPQIGQTGDGALGGFSLDGPEPSAVVFRTQTVFSEWGSAQMRSMASGALALSWLVH